MGKGIFFLKEFNYIYNMKLYSYDLKQIKIDKVKKRSLYILDEELYSKRYHYESGEKIDDKKINNWIENDFVVDTNYLFDYKINYLHKYVDVYAIKGGINVKKLCMGVEKVKVIPIQLKIFNDMKRKIREKQWSIILKLKERYYYIKVDLNRIINTIVEEDKEQFLKRLSNEKDDNSLYIDSALCDISFDRSKKIKVGGLFYEKLHI